MRKLFTLLTTLALLCAVGCEEKGDDNVDPNDKTEQPEEKPDDGSEIPDDAYISINKDILTFSPDGESVDIKVYSNYEWTLTNNCDWVTTSISGGEASEGGTTITLSADLTYDDREGTIIFSCGKAREVLVVSQSFKETIIADENNTFNVPAEGGNVIINYQTSVECEVIIPEEAKSWISLAPATRALVSESATLTVAENTTYSERSAVVKVVKVGDNTLFAEYTINQVQNDAIIADKNNTFNLSGLAQSINIAYKTNVEREVIIPEEAQSWITLAPKTRALVNESVTLNVADNNTGAARSAVVKVVAANNKELVAEYTITQNQRYFMEYTSKDGYTVSPYDSSAFDATIIRNEYIDGKGYIDFDTPVTEIGDYAFRGCKSLTSITIPDSVTSIGDYAFSGCTSLPIENNIRYADTYVVEVTDKTLTSYTLKENVRFIGSYTFSGCKSLTSVTIPDSVTSIGIYAFSGCSSLTSVTIGNGVTSIGIYAFSGCTSLTSVTIGNGVTEIGDYAFYNCTGELIVNCNIPDGRNWHNGEYVGAFTGSKFTKATIGDGVRQIGEYAFNNCSSLTSVTIGNGVTSIGIYAFSGCTSLTSIIIPDSVTSIEREAFDGCTSLTSVTIGNGVTSIGIYAFATCTSLTSVTIGNGVTQIGACAFYDCTSLTSVYCKATTPPTGGNYMFSYYINGGYVPIGCTIYVPTESVNAYKSATYWSDYADLIYGYDF